MRSRAQFTGRVPPVVEILACVVYDPSTGSIAHVHRTVRFQGAKPVSKEDLAAQALEMAGRHHKRGGLEVLHLAGEDLELSRTSSTPWTSRASG